jgi:hypothetical protein
MGLDCSGQGEGIAAKKDAYYTLGNSGQVRGAIREFLEDIYGRRMSREGFRALRANPVFGADEKRIRTKNRVMDKINSGGRDLRRRA